MRRTSLVSLVVLIPLLLSSCGVNNKNGDSGAAQIACEYFEDFVITGIQDGDSDAVLAATALSVYQKAKESGNKVLIDASSSLYDGFNLPDLGLASKAVVDLKVACSQK